MKVTNRVHTANLFVCFEKRFFFQLVLKKPLRAPILEVPFRPFVAGWREEEFPGSIRSKTVEGLAWPGPITSKKAKTTGRDTCHTCRFFRNAAIYLEIFEILVNTGISTYQHPLVTTDFWTINSINSLTVSGISPVLVSHLSRWSRAFFETNIKRFKPHWFEAHACFLDMYGQWLSSAINSQTQKWVAFKFGSSLNNKFYDIGFIQELRLAELWVSTGQFAWKEIPPKSPTLGATGYHHDLTTTRARIPWGDTTQLHHLVGVRTAQKRWGGCPWNSICMWHQSLWGCHPNYRGTPPNSQ